MIGKLLLGAGVVGGLAAGGYYGYKWYRKRQVEKTYEKAKEKVSGAIAPVLGAVGIGERSEGERPEYDPATSAWKYAEEEPRGMHGHHPHAYRRRPSYGTDWYDDRIC